MVPRTRKPKARIFDSVLIESGEAQRRKYQTEADLAEVLRNQRKKPAKFEATNEALQENRRYLREQGVNQQDISKELALQKLLNPLYSMLLSAREKKKPPKPGEKRVPLTKMEKLVDQLVGGAEVKPRVAVVSPSVMSRIVATIYKSHPEIVAWLKERGLTVEDGTWLMRKVLDYTKPRDKAAFIRRVNRRGGILWEMLLPFDAKVVSVEREIALESAIQWIKAEPRRFAAKTQQDVEKLINALNARFAEADATPVHYGEGIFRTEDNPGIGEVDVLAENLWLMRLTEIRDEGGRLVMDHKRALVSFSEGAIDVTPVGVGESKFGSKAAAVFEQMVRNVGRATETFRAANLPDPAALQVRVRWGERLAVVAQTEAKGDLKAPANLEAAISKAAGKNLKITFVQAGTAKGAETSRKIVDAFLRLLLEPGALVDTE